MTPKELQVNAELYSNRETKELYKSCQSIQNTYAGLESHFIESFNIYNDTLEKEIN